MSEETKTPSAPINDAKGKRKKHFAHSQILHDGKIINKGDAIPDYVGDDSLKQLVADRHAHTEPPGETKLERPDDKK